MANQHGNFLWYELMTNDVSAAQAFYGPLLGWQFADSGQADRVYQLASMNGNNICGLMPIPEGADMPPCWMGYLGVNDVDRAVVDLTKAGGTTYMEPLDIENVGRIAFVSDPQGAMFYVMHSGRSGSEQDNSSPPFAAEQPMIGHCAWNELMTSDQSAALSFYSKQFSWHKEDDAMDMGEAGSYEFLRHGSHMIAGIMKKPAEVPISAWSYYFRVSDIDKSVQIIKDNGGHLLAEPMEIPGGEFALQAIDPQQAMFALVGPRVL